MSDRELDRKVATVLGWNRLQQRLTGTPNYSGDLNLCASFEKEAPTGYADAVRFIVAQDAQVQPQHLCDQYLIQATASQRCRAFLYLMSGADLISPQKQKGLIKLNEHQERVIEEWAPDADAWCDTKARRINLATFARQILKHDGGAA